MEYGSEIDFEVSVSNRRIVFAIGLKRNGTNGKAAHGRRGMMTITAEEQVVIRESAIEIEGGKGEIVNGAAAGAETGIDVGTAGEMTNQISIRKSKMRQPKGRLRRLASPSEKLTRRSCLARVELRKRR